jgi:uncharacterized protein YabE (DUF348 family)
VGHRATKRERTKSQHIEEENLELEQSIHSAYIMSQQIIEEKMDIEMNKIRKLENHLEKRIKLETYLRSSPSLC